MRPIIVKCVRKTTDETLNGPVTYVTLQPDGHLETNDGKLIIFGACEADVAEYKVGKLYRLNPEPL